MRRLNAAILLTAGLTTCLSGCAATATSNTARTAREQMLLSNAIDQSLAKVDFRPLGGQRVFLQEKYLECVDKPYIVGSIRHRVMRSGAFLVESAEDADIVMEVRSGGVGTDSTESYLGTPEIALPGMLTVPEIRVAERKSQYGYAKLGMVLYDAKTRQVLGDGGVAIAQSNDSNSYVMGIGPLQTGSLKRDVQRSRETTPAMARRELPPMVAFGTRTEPVPAAGEVDVQFASESKVVE